MIKPISLYNTLNTSFGSISRTIYDDKKPDHIRYKNNTWMFRGDLAWNAVVNEITKDNKPKKIYCYACSDGSEPYSLAMVLISKLGWKKAQRYFPIIARDIDETMIKRAKSGVIELNPDDMGIIEDYQKKSKTKFFNEFTLKKSGKNQYKYNGVVSDKLRSCVDFGVGDICQDAKGLNYDNAVIFFRNALPYLPDKKRKLLLATLEKNINDTTAIVIGDFDRRVIGNPFLFMKNNHTYGLFEVIDNFFVGKRLKDLYKLKKSGANTGGYRYTNISQISHSTNINMCNKIIKAENIKKNRF